VSAANVAAAASSTERYSSCASPVRTAVIAARGFGNARRARVQDHSGGIPESANAAPHPTGTS
jgi:hypothetical protein